MDPLEVTPLGKIQIVSRFQVLQLIDVVLPSVKIVRVSNSDVWLVMQNDI